MKNIKYKIGTASAFLLMTPMLALPIFVSAQGGGFTESGGTGAGVNNLFENLTTFISETALPFLMALAFLAFVWGMFVYFIAGGGNDEKKEKGKQLMIYAVLGFVLIIILWGLVNFLADALGLRGETITIPTIPTGT